MNGLKRGIDYRVTHSFNAYFVKRIASGFKGFNIIHLYDPPKSILRIEKLLGIFTKTKVICHFTDIPAMESFNDLNKKLKDVPDIFLFPHSELLKVFRRNIKARGKNELMINGVDEDALYPQALKQLSFKKEILSCGDFYSGSKIYVVIEAMKYLPAEYFLTCMGRIFDQSYYDQMKDLISNLGVESKVEIISEYDEKLFRDKCRESNIYVTPSKEFDEVFKAHEALMCGTVVLYPVDDYKFDGLVTMESIAPKIIAKHIKNICEGDLTVDVEIASKLFSWKTRIRELESIYERLVS